MPSELTIQKELLRHGPVVAALNTDDDYSFAQGGAYDDGSDPSFSYYASGVMKQDQRPDTPAFAQAPESIQVPSDGSINFAQTARGHATQELGHSILIVGWKTDKETNTPVWIARNSYGDRWGMNGDFHVRRGMDDFGIESEVEGHIVELLQ